MGKEPHVGKELHVGKEPHVGKGTTCGEGTSGGEGTSCGKGTSCGERNLMWGKEPRVGKGTSCGHTFCEDFFLAETTEIAFRHTDISVLLGVVYLRGKTHCMEIRQVHWTIHII